MSDPPRDDSDRLNLRELLTRIDRQREEALKFAAEQHKLAAETAKLTAEAAKFGRERFFAPFALVVASMGAGAALFGAGIAFWRVVGG